MCYKALLEMKIVVIGDRTGDNAIDICCSFLEYKQHSYSIFSSHESLASQIADLTIISYSQLIACGTIDGGLFIVSAEPDTKSIPSIARFVFNGASEQEIIFRLNQCIQSLVQVQATEATLLNTIFDTCSSINFLVDKDGTVERFRTEIESASQDNLFATRGKLLSCIHAYNKKGCGHGLACQICNVRNLTASVFDTGVSIRNQPCSITISSTGNERPVLLSASRIFLGGVPKVLMSINDAEENLSDSLTNIASLTVSELEASATMADIGFWELDLHSFVSRGSEVWNRLLGLSNEDQDFDVWSANIPASQYKELMHKITRLIRNEDQSFEHSFSYMNEDLGEIWIDLKGYVSQFTPDGRPCKITGVIQDITNIVNTEQELLTQQANQKAMLENTEARIWLVDPQYRIIEMNEQFRRSFNAIFNADFAKGRIFTSLLPSDIGIRWKSLFDKAFMGNSLQVADVVRSQNSERHFETRLTPVTIGDAVVAVSCYLTEVTVQKRYEQMLKLARKTAEEANRAKSQFLANMSHEIRTPLNAILGFSEILQATEKEPEKTAYLKSIKKSGNMLLNIINDVLDLSKIEAGKVPINPEFTDVHTLLTDTFDPFVFRASQKKLIFDADISQADKYLLYIDGFRFRQIMLNLLSNAIKFTETGAITCRASIGLTSEQEALLQIQISDTGIGIDSTQLNAIFSPFQQQENQDSRKFEGTGLGLAITKQLVELLGGTIEVNSVQNVGSTFSVTFAKLPFREKKSADEIKTAEKLPLLNFSGKHALVADDLPDHRRVIGGYLHLYGMKVTYASDGADVFSQLESCVPDIIFMDLRMPGINGYKAFAELHKNQIWQHIPVVAVTAEAFATEEDIVGNKGFSHLLRKPLQLNDLHRVLSDIFQPTVASESTASSASALTEGAPAAFVEQLRLMASPLMRKQPRKDLLLLADFLSEEGMRRGMPQLAVAGEELRAATNTFNIAKIREIISELI